MKKDYRRSKEKRKLEYKKFLTNRLRNLRLLFNCSQQNIADALGMNRSTYTYYETGKTTPDIWTFMELARIYGITVIELLDPDFDVKEAKKPRNTQKLLIKEKPNVITELSEDERTLIAIFRAKEGKKESLDDIANLLTK